MLPYLILVIFAIQPALNLPQQRSGSISPHDIKRDLRQKKGFNLAYPLPMTHHLLVPSQLHVLPATSNVHHSSVHTGVQHIVTSNGQIPVYSQTVSHSSTDITHPTQLVPILVPIQHNLVPQHNLMPQQNHQQHNLVSQQNHQQHNLVSQQNHQQHNLVSQQNHQQHNLVSQQNHQQHNLVSQQNHQQHNLGSQQNHQQHNLGSQQNHQQHNLVSQQNHQQHNLVSQQNHQQQNLVAQHNLIQHNLLHDLSVIPLHRAQKFGHLRVEKKAENREDINHFRTFYGGFGNGLYFGGHGAGHGFYAYGK